MSVGYYVHHRGAGHLHRALAIANALGSSVTILSSLPRDDRWTGEWIELPLDHADDPRDARASGALHWVPLRSDGLRERSAAISAWIERERPRAIVVDVSVEVALLARLHGVPVVTVAQPGDRTDSPHTLGYRISSAVIAPWPSDIRPLRVETDVEARIEAIGAISRLAPSITRNPRTELQVGVLAGYGGRGESALDAVVREAAAALPDYHWVRPETAGGVEAMLATSGIVFAHCGQNSVAEIAAARVPAVLVPENRPHDEQRSLARALAGSTYPALIGQLGDDWAAVVATAPDGSAWENWCDGHAAERAAAIIERVAS
jgi:UDP-N-acetylglucosamine:LPS N-acetylglucosamine transferase